jgi:hypothetical protein
MATAVLAIRQVFLFVGDGNVLRRGKLYRRNYLSQSQPDIRAKNQRLAWTRLHATVPEWAPMMEIKI